MKPVLTLAAVLLLGPAAFAQEPPAPPVAPDSAPARLVEPRADELVRKMSDLLTASKAFALEAEEVYDEVPEDLPRVQLTSRRHVALRRPDRAAGTAAGDAINRSVWYDGKTLTVLDDAQNVYMRMEAPPTLDGTMDTALDRTGMVIPLADFLYSDVYDRLMGSVERGVYLGIHDVGGIACHHLAFQQETIDWQLWIDAGPQALPRKLVIAYKTEDGVPQYEVTIRKWNLAADVPDSLFEFQPPPGAKKVELPVIFAAGAQTPEPHSGRTAAADAADKAAGETGEEAMRRRATAVLASIIVVLGQTAPLLAGGRGGGGGGADGVRGVEGRVWRRRLLAEPQRERLRFSLGHPDEQRLQRQPAGFDCERSLPRGQQERRHERWASPERESHIHRDQRIGAVGQPRSDDDERGRLRLRPGKRQHEHRTRGLGPGRRWEERVRADRRHRKRQHEVQRLLRRRSEANPNGTWNTATAGPNGVKVTQTLPSGYKTTTYAGTPYYGSASVYYRPYTYYGAPYYYPVPAALLLPVRLRAGGGDRRDRRRRDLHDVGGGATTSRPPAARGRSSTRRCRPRKEPRSRRCRSSACW